MRQILIIDDDADIRLLMVMMLTSAGFAVAEAESGEEGLAYLASQKADCVFLDINMPGLPGWEVCRRIKANPATTHIPVIIQTVRSAVKDEAEFASARPDGFLNKPFQKSDLLAAMDEAMAKVAVS